jgi:Domain of unknown function (DUF1707)
MTDAGHSAVPAILASDAERERSVDVLRDAVVDGRLTLEEFTDRVGIAQTAPSAPPIPGAPRMRIRLRGPGGTPHVHNRRAAPPRLAKLLGAGETDTAR